MQQEWNALEVGMLKKRLGQELIGHEYCLNKKK